MEKNIPIRVSKSQLAEMYFPETTITVRRKLQLLKQWIDEDSECVKSLQSTKNFNSKSHFFTRDQLHIIYQNIGYPCQNLNNENPKH